MRCPSRPLTRSLYGLLLAGSVWLTTGCSSSSSDPRPTLHDKGSDTMLPVAQAWADAYDRARVEVAAGGSCVGIGDLIEKKIDLARASRPATAAEIQKAYEETGKTLRPTMVGLDAIAVYVHATNPLEEISLEQLAAIFGENGKLNDWSQLGVTVPGCRDNRIVATRRDSNSGTHDVFQRRVLGEKGTFDPEAIEIMTSRDLVTLISYLPCSIGYGSLSYRTEEVKVLKVKVGDAPGVLPSPETVSSNAYPLARPLYIYTLGPPRRAAREYLDWILSPAGQTILRERGGVPLSSESGS